MAFRFRCDRGGRKMTEKFPYEYYQNLEKLESAIQLVKLDLLPVRLLSSTHLRSISEMNFGSKSLILTFINILQYNIG